MPNDTLTFTPGTTRLEVVVLIDDDDVVESTETFLAQLTKIGPKVTLGSPDKLRVYIEDDDGKYMP